MKWLATIALAVLPLLSWAQHNDWVQFDRPYAKFKAAQDAIYRVSYDQLAAAGLPVATLDPRNLVVMWRGAELRIRVVGEADGSFDPGDYLELYGMRNRGALDSELYIDNSVILNDEFGLFSDSTAYFVTTGDAPGRRINTVTQSNPALPIEPYGWFKATRYELENYSNGRSYPPGLANVYLSDFDQGEGFTSRTFRQGTGRRYLLADDFDGVVAAPENALVEMLVVGRSNNNRTVNLIKGTDIVNGAPTVTTTVQSVNLPRYDGFILSAELDPATDFTGDQINIDVTSDNPGYRTFTSVSWLRVTAPVEYRAPATGQRTFATRSSASGQLRVQVANATATTRVFDVTDPYNATELGGTLAGGVLELIVPQAFVQRTLLVSQEPLPVASVRAVQFRALDATTADYLMVSDPVLRAAAGAYADPLQAYIDYRQSPAGGSHTVLYADMQQLYDQFSYGEYTPLALRHFAEYCLQQGNPEYLLLIGYGLDVALNPGRVDPSIYSRPNLVPVIGAPSSDAFISMGLAPGTNGPALATGRLNFFESAQLAGYLDKVKEHESPASENLWHKRMVHLTGGATAEERVSFAQLMNQNATLAEQGPMGASVTTISKSTNNAVELINLSEQVNEGVGLITFFGHSSATATDITIGFVSDPALGYANVGRYPLILVNGCNSGSIFRLGETYGEDWMTAENSGALAFVAHSDFGLVNQLRDYADTYYQEAFTDPATFPPTLGSLTRQSASFLTDLNDSELNRSTAQQIIVQGDPALRLFPFDLPDYSPLTSSLEVLPFSGQRLNSRIDSMQVRVVVNNYGVAPDQDLEVAISQVLPSGTVVQHPAAVVPATKYSDTLLLTVLRNGEEWLGQHVITVTVDPDNLIAEEVEVNNAATFSAFVPASNMRNLYPRQDEVVAEGTLSLLAIAGDPTEQNRAVVMEVDTTADFSSPYAQQYNLQASPLVEQALTLLPNTADSVVYYWRTQYSTPSELEDPEGDVFAFTHIPGSPATWRQGRQPQLERGQLQNLVVAEPGPTLSFTTTDVELQVATFGQNHPTSGSEDLSIVLDGVPFAQISGFLCRDNTLNLIAFDRDSGVPYPVIDFGPLNARSCGREPQVINSFTSAEITGSQNQLVNFTTAVAAGDRVVGIGLGQLNPGTWPAEEQAALETLGISAAQVAALSAGEAFVFVSEKGAAAGSATLFQADDASPTPADEQAVAVSETLSFLANQGQLTSPLIGPASTWGSLELDLGTADSGTESALVDVYGVNGQSTTLLFADVAVDQLDLSTVDATAHPQLQLVYKVSDTENRTPVRLGSWLTSYQPLPNGVVFPTAVPTRPTSQPEASSYAAAYTWRKVTPEDFAGPLAVVAQLRSDQDEQQLVASQLTAAQANAGGDFSLELSTLGQVGTNELSLSVNADLAQPESSLAENFYVLPQAVTVTEDDTHPLIDLTIDGKYIVDGEIVSPSPVIDIRIRDENELLLKTDTVGLTLLFRQDNCKECSFERVAFSSPRVTWQPATEQSDFHVVYRPGPLPNGSYTLSMRAADGTGNTAGAQPLRQRFEVVNEATVTNFFPYPNPFSTSTRFVFTLTGAEVPDEIKIQIMTLSGRVVREITQEELGPVTIGQNISQYAWPGTDEFGQELANGVYLYRVVVMQNGQRLDQRTTSADRGFKHGIGKLYILR